MHLQPAELRPDELVRMTVAQIIEATGVGKRHAYSMKRDANIALAPELPQNQRDRMLVTLFQHPDAKRSQDLLRILNKEGSEIDGHDVVKVLWSLQKSDLVHFREHQRPPRALYAISLTKAGIQRAQQLVNLLVDDLDTTEETAVDVVTATYTNGIDIAAIEGRDDAQAEAIKEAEIIDLDKHIRAMPDAGDRLVAPVIVPWVQGDMGGWNELRALRDKARKAGKLNQAAALLESVGEDEMAVTIMDMSAMTPLEQEVVSLLQHLGELP